MSDSTTWPRWFDGVVELNRNLGAMPLIGSNSANLIGDYEGSLEAMTEAIRGAERYVHVEFYIFAYDRTTAPFFDALGDAVARGVEVRVLLDHIASLRVKGYRKTLKRLDRMGVRWQLMLPVQPFRGRYQRPDLRNHRKILVVDGEIGFMGSQNIIDRSYNKPGNIRRGLKWKELVVRVEGPIVSGLEAIFTTDWYLETGEAPMREIVPLGQEGAAQDLDCQVVPSGPGYTNENNLKLFLALMYAAEERIILTSPYFVPDEAMLRAISGATQRGRSRGALRVGDRRPGPRVPRAAVVLRGTAAGRSEDLALPGAVHPALEALHDRRRRRRHRVEQHGHPLVRAQHGGVAPRSRRLVRARDARRRRRLSPR